MGPLGASKNTDFASRDLVHTCLTTVWLGIAGQPRSSQCNRFRPAAADPQDRARVTRLPHHRSVYRGWRGGDRARPCRPCLQPNHTARQRPATAGDDHIQNVLADTRSIPRQFVAVERFLNRRIRPQNVSPRIEAAVKLIRSSEGRASIANLARHAAISQSTLERHFRTAVGATPKMLSRLPGREGVLSRRTMDSHDVGKSLHLAAGRRRAG